MGEGQLWLRALRARESTRKYNNANASHCDTNAKRGSAYKCVPVFVCVCVLYKGLYATALYLLRSLPRRDWKLINKAILISANLTCSCSCCCLFLRNLCKNNKHIYWASQCRQRLRVGTGVGGVCVVCGAKHSSRGGRCWA